MSNIGTILERYKAPAKPGRNDFKNLSRIDSAAIIIPQEVERSVNGGHLHSQVTVYRASVCSLVLGRAGHFAPSTVSTQNSRRFKPAHPVVSYSLVNFTSRNRRHVTGRSRMLLNIVSLTLSRHFIGETSFLNSSIIESTS